MSSGLAAPEIPWSGVVACKIMCCKPPRGTSNATRRLTAIPSLNFLSKADHKGGLLLAWSHATGFLQELSWCVCVCVCVCLKTGTIFCGQVLGGSHCLWDRLVL